MFEEFDSAAIYEVIDEDAQYPELCSGYDTYHTNRKDAARPRPLAGVTLAQIRSMADRPQSVDKSRSQWLIPSTLKSRAFDEQKNRGKYWMLWADLDNDPPPTKTLPDILEKIIPNFDFEIYSSRSAKENLQKARILVPLKKPLSGDDWLFAQEVFFEKLADYGIVFDKTAKRSAQLCYLPNRGEFYENYHQRHDAFFDPLTAWHGEIATKKATTKAQEAQLKQARLEAKERRESLRIDEFSHPIDAFNATYEVSEIMIQGGYSQRGQTFRHPNSSSGSYSASVKNGRVHSLSSSDPLYTDGGGVGGHDAFGAFTVLFHNGDEKAALKDACDNWLTVGGLSWNEAKRQYQSNQFKDTADWAASQPFFKTDYQADPWMDGDELGANAKAAKYIVNGILETAAHGILGAQSQAFKSFLAIKLAHSICTGQDFFDQKTFVTGPVLYICGEGAGALQRRIKAAQIAYGSFDGNLKIWSGGIAIDDQIGMDALKKHIAKLEPALVIFDTFSSLVWGDLNENDNAQVARVLRLVRDACTVGDTSSLIVHHYGKSDQAGFRGASAFFNNIDFGFAMKRDGDAMNAELSCVKMKDGELFKPINMLARVVELGLENQDGSIATSLCLEHDALPVKTIKKRKLKERDAAILASLREAIVAHGIEPTAEIKAKDAGFDTLIGRQQKIVNIEHWRELAYNTMSSDQNKRQTFWKARNKFRDEKYTVEDGDFVWPYHEF